MQKSGALLSAVLIVIMATGVARAQPVPFTSEAWTYSEGSSHRLENYLGEETLYLENGTATLMDAEFLNGIIEFDIATNGLRAFPGVRWRVQDPFNAEEFYIRPQQSGKADAMQYTPVTNGLSAWQLYHGPIYSVPHDYKVDQWMHIKIVVKGDQADIYIDSDEPILHVPKMKREAASGGFSIRAGLQPARYANFSYMATDEVEIVGNADGIMPPALENRIETWRISNFFDGAIMDGFYSLDEMELDDTDWREVPSEITGITNLAPMADLGVENGNTLLVAVTVTVGQDAARSIRFGYSDKVRLYLNDKLIYQGDNSYRSRDFRYLGTIGLFDELFLPLKEGDNEIVFAVTEAFGGFGIMAQIPNRENISITP